MMSIYSPNSATLTSAVTGGDPAALVLSAGVSEWTNAAYGAVGDVAYKRGLTDGSASKVLMHAAVGGVTQAAIQATTGGSKGAIISGALAAGAVEAAGATEGASRILAGAVALSTGASAATIESAAERASGAIEHNRRAHYKEVLTLREAQYGQSANKCHKLEAAAAYLIKADAGIAATDQTEQAKRIRGLAAEGVNYEAEQRQLKALAEAKGYGGRFEYGLIDRIEDFATRQDIVARMFGSKETIETIASQVAIQASNTHPAIRAPMTAMNAYGAYESAAQTTTGDGGGHRLESERVAESFSAVAESTQSAYMEQMEHYMARSIKAEAMGAAIGAGVQRAAAVAGAASKLAMKKAVPVTGNATTAPTTQAKPVQIRAAQTAQAAPQQTSILGPKAKYKVNTAGERVAPDKRVAEVKKEKYLKGFKPKDPNKVQVIRGKDGRIVGMTHVESHHIIPRAKRKHKIWNLSGVNPDAALNRIALPTKRGAELMPREKRTIHQGRHVKAIDVSIEKKLDDLVIAGRKNGFTEQEYRDELLDIIRQEKSNLLSGKTALNKHVRQHE